MGRYACVMMLPQDENNPTRADFLSHEFDSFDEILASMNQLNATYPKWQLVSFCHVEDLPLLTEPPPSGKPERENLDPYAEPPTRTVDAVVRRSSGRVDTYTVRRAPPSGEPT